jgi:hypothetical protein
MAKFQLNDRVLETNQALRSAFSGARITVDDGKSDPRPLTMKDAISVPDAPMVFPKVINNVVREAIEPLLIGTSLLQRINYSGYGQTITFGATGGLIAGDIAEGQEYPEQNLQVGAGIVTATIGKSGVAVKITEEMLRYSQFDLIGLNLRAAGKALARLKEGKIFNMIRAEGAVIFDNATPTSSLKGVTTGRSLDGSGNGSMTMDDLFDAWAHVVAQGFMPDTLIMHPLAWTMFVKDATMRAIALESGNMNAWFGSWTGSPQGGNPAWANANQGGLGPSYGQNIVPGGGASGLTPTSSGDQSQVLTSAPVLPTYGPKGLSVVVTPYMPFNASTKLTDIYLCDRSELGFLIVDEEPTTEDFEDPARDLRKIKIRERYALAINNEGMGVGVLKNVKCVPNEVVLPAEVKLDASAITPLPAGTAVV